MPFLVAEGWQPELPEKQAAWPKASWLSRGSEGLFDQRHAVGLGCLVYVKSILVRFSNSVGSRGTILADLVSMGSLQRWSGPYLGGLPPPSGWRHIGQGGLGGLPLTGLIYDLPLVTFLSLDF